MFWNGSTAIEGLSGSGSARCKRFRGACQVDAIDSHGARDVFQHLLPQIDEGLRQLVADLAPDILRKTDAARVRDAFQPRRDVDAVAQQVGAIDHDIAQVNSDPEGDEAVGSDLGIALRHTALHGQRAAHGVDDARKLDQDAVAGGLDDAAAMHRDGRIDQLQPYGA